MLPGPEYTVGIVRGLALPVIGIRPAKGSAVIGKWVSKIQYASMDDLTFSLQKNGEVVQQASTALMLWKIDELIAYVSSFFTLKKGDIIFTGTPAGVGAVASGDYLEGFVECEPFFDLKVR